MGPDSPADGIQQPAAVGGAEHLHMQVPPTLPQVEEVQSAWPDRPAHGGGSQLVSCRRGNGFGGVFQPSAARGMESPAVEDNRRLRVVREYLSRCGHW